MNSYKNKRNFMEMRIPNAYSLKKQSHTTFSIHTQPENEFEQSNHTQGKIELNKK
jgi:hypothetical protein